MNRLFFFTQLIHHILLSFTPNHSSITRVIRYLKTISLLHLLILSISNRRRLMKLIDRTLIIGSSHVEVIISSIQLLMAFLSHFIAILLQQLVQLLLLLDLVNRQDFVRILQINSNQSLLPNRFVPCKINPLHLFLGQHFISAHQIGSFDRTVPLLLIIITASQFTFG